MRRAGVMPARRRCRNGPTCTEWQACGSGAFTRKAQRHSNGGALWRNGDVVSQALGIPLVRKEDPALLSGHGRYADDLPVPNGTLHAHVIRSPHPHARILGIDAADALALPGVAAVITGEDVRKLTDPFLIALKRP